MQLVYLYKTKKYKIPATPEKKENGPHLSHPILRGIYKSHLTFQKHQKLLQSCYCSDDILHLGINICQHEDIS